MDSDKDALVREQMAADELRMMLRRQRLEAWENKKQYELMAENAESTIAYLDRQIEVVARYIGRIYKEQHEKGYGDY